LASQQLFKLWNSRIQLRSGFQQQQRLLLASQLIQQQRNSYI
jgi:hypothetical protein